MLSGEAEKEGGRGPLLFYFFENRPLEIRGKRISLAFPDIPGKPSVP